MEDTGDKHIELGTNSGAHGIIDGSAYLSRIWCDGCVILTDTHSHWHYVQIRIHFQIPNGLYFFSYSCAAATYKCKYHRVAADSSSYEKHNRYVHRRCSCHSKYGNILCKRNNKIY